MNNRTEHLRQAQKIRDDEFYTKIEDVEAELSHWKHRLKNKRIICPCDGPESAFVKYLESVKEDWQIKSITYSSYNPFTKEGKPFQELDYSNYDICITNPPFSLYKEFLQCIIDKIDFILLAPMLGRQKRIEHNILRQHKCFFGFNRAKGLNFTNTDKKVACDWITSFDDYNFTYRYYDCSDWTELPITCLSYISTYDYDFMYCQFVDDRKMYKHNFHFYLKKINTALTKEQVEDNLKSKIEN